MAVLTMVKPRAFHGRGKGPGDRELVLCVHSDPSAQPRVLDIFVGSPPPAQTKDLEGVEGVGAFTLLSGYMGQWNPKSPGPELPSSFELPSW